MNIQNHQLALVLDLTDSSTALGKGNHPAPDAVFRRGFLLNCTVRRAQLHVENPATIPQQFSCGPDKSSNNLHGTPDSLTIDHHWTIQFRKK
eukprot:s2082_g4.t1